MIGNPPFKTGDIVRLKTGKSAIQVIEVDYFHCSTLETSPPRIKKWAKPRKGWYIRFVYCRASACDNSRNTA